MPQEWKSDPEVIIKHDELYARAWESDFGKHCFDKCYNELSPPKQGEVTMEPDQTNAGTCSTLGPSRESSPEIFPPTDDLCDGSDTYPTTKPKAELNSEQPSHTPTNPRSTKYDIRHIPKSDCNDDYRHWTLYR